MNILIFVAMPTIPNRGGIERVNVALKDIFEKHGHKVWYLSGKLKDTDRDLVDRERQYSLPEHSRTFATPANFRLLDEIIEKNEIDVFLNQQFPELVPFLSHVKRCHPNLILISCLHSVYQNGFEFNFNKMIGFLSAHGLGFLKHALALPLIDKVATAVFKHFSIDRRIVDSTKNSDVVALLSEGLKPGFYKHFKDARVSLPKTPVVVVPNPYPYPPQAVDCSKKENIVLFVGRLDTMFKRPELMIKIWAKLEKKYPNWRLVVVGDGPARSMCENLIGELKLERVSMKGCQESKPYFYRSKIFCSSSSKESFPVVLLEAAACKCVPVAFDSFPAARERISDGVNGCLVKPFDLDAYAETLSELMTNPAKCERMANQAWKDIEEFAPENIYRKWMSVIENIKSKKIKE